MWGSLAQNPGTASSRMITGAYCEFVSDRSRRDELRPGGFVCAPLRAKATFGSVISPPDRAEPLLWQAVNGLATPNAINPAANPSFAIRFRMGNDSRTTYECKQVTAARPPFDAPILSTFLQDRFRPGSEKNSARTREISALDQMLPQTPPFAAGLVP